MAHVLSSFLLAFSANIDNFAVAIAYGVKKLHIGILSNLLIAFVSAMGAVLSMAVGTSISRYLPNPVANVLGSGVLIAIGLWGIWDTIEREKRRNLAKLRQNRTRSEVASGMPQPDSSMSPTFSSEVTPDLTQDLSYQSFLEDPARADVDRSGYIDVKESIALAFGLTINNLGTGVGAGMSGLNIPFTAVLTFLVSVIAISLGYILGDRFTTKMTGISAGVVSGLMIIGLGVYEYFVP